MIYFLRKICIFTLIGSIAPIIYGFFLIFSSLNIFLSVSSKILNEIQPFFPCAVLGLYIPYGSPLYIALPSAIIIYIIATFANMLLYGFISFIFLAPIEFLLFCWLRLKQIISRLLNKH